jgi:UDP-N-acetylglucosamine:LPS N-acetylglucosamine transferase
LLPEKKTTPEELFHAVRELAAQPALRHQMAEAAKKLARPRAAEMIVDTCLSLIG